MSATRQTTFDPASVSKGTWAAAGAAVVLLISTFLAWYSASFGPISVSVNGWHYGSGKIVGILAIVALVVIAIELFAAAAVPMPAPTSLVLAGLGAACTILVLYRLIAGQTGAGTDIGVWLALVSSLGLAGAGYLKMQEPA